MFLVNFSKALQQNFNIFNVSIIFIVSISYFIEIFISKHFYHKDENARIEEDYHQVVNKNRYLTLAFKVLILGC